jgi:hypothetical protein
MSTKQFHPRTGEWILAGLFAAMILLYAGMAFFHLYPTGNEKRQNQNKLSLRERSHQTDPGYW